MKVLLHFVTYFQYPILRLLGINHPTSLSIPSLSLSSLFSPQLQQHHHPIEMAPPTSAQDRTFIIGISGSPFSGKTTLANNLIKEISLLYNVDVLLLSQLDYHSGDEQGATMDPFLFTPSNRDEKNWRNIADPKCIRPVFYDVIKTMVELGKCKFLEIFNCILFLCYISLLCYCLLWFALYLL